MNKLHILTVATHNEGYYNALNYNANKYNINLTTLGFGQKWTGFTMKFDLINKYINTLDDNDIVVFTDAFDVLIIQDSNTIINKFKSFNKPIVISKDGDPHSLIIMYIHSRIFDKCNNTKINSGLYIGYVWALKLLYEQIYKELNNIDDQIILINICSNNDFFNKYITIDYNSILFYTTFGGYGILNYDFTLGFDSNIINNKLIVNTTNQEPSFVHGPGNTNLDLLTDLYNLPKNINRFKLDKVLIYSKPFYLKYYINDILLSIGIILIIFLIMIKPINYFSITH
jgi:hypothetical protein